MVNEGKFDAEIKAEKTEITEEEKKQIEAERQKLQKELEEKRTMYEAQAKKIIAQNEKKSPEQIRKALEDAKIPDQIIAKLAPKAEGGKKK